MDWRHLAGFKEEVGLEQSWEEWLCIVKGSHFNVRTFMPELPGGPGGSPQEGTLEEGE